MTKDREEWWKAQLQHERERQTVWEEGLQTVVREREALECELPTRSRKRGSRFFDVGANDGTGTLRQRPVTLVSTSASVPEEHIPTPSYFAPSQRPAPITIVSTPEDVDGNGDGVSTAIVQSPATATATLGGHQNISRHIQDNEDIIDTDEEDEFFDAIEANMLPNLLVSQFLTSPIHAEPELSFMCAEHFAEYH